MQESKAIAGESVEIPAFTTSQLVQALVHLVGSLGAHTSKVFGLSVAIATLCVRKKGINVISKKTPE